ncbi:MAG: hypothetical protein LBP56_09035 [Odoribacteraceae bacterium]|jgi:hypothetical protein|nr:hypothetical protein [Odoribacteraceae bacterium]
MNRFMLIAAFACLMTACGKDATDHPDHAKIISLVTDWEDRGSEIDIPSDYTVSVGERAFTCSGTVNAIEELFAAGQYPLRVYNTAPGITVEGRNATADYAAGVAGWFFTGADNITVERDREYALTIAMRQQVRQLTLELEIGGDARDHLTSVDAALSGVAGAWEIDSDRPSGGAVTVTPLFVQSGDTYSAVIRLLGITGSSQSLSLTLHFAGGNPSSYTVTSELSARLAAFNEEKKNPLTLSSVLVVTPTQGGFVSAISDWTAGSTSTGVAE